MEELQNNVKRQICLGHTFNPSNLEAEARQRRCIAESLWENVLELK